MEAFYIYNGNVKENLFETFGLLVTADYPEESHDVEMLQFLVYVGLIFFTIYLLNIFISVISEAYTLEKNQVQLTFCKERASGSFTFLVRALVLPSRFAGRPTLAICIAGVIAGLILQFFDLSEWMGSELRRVEIGMYIFVVMTLNLTIFQQVEPAWPTGDQRESRQYYLWLALPEDPKERPAGVTSTLEAVQRTLDMEMRRIRESLHHLAVSVDSRAGAVPASMPVSMEGQSNVTSKPLAPRRTMTAESNKSGRGSKRLSLSATELDRMRATIGNFDNHDDHYAYLCNDRHA